MDEARVQMAGLQVSRVRLGWLVRAKWGQGPNSTLLTWKVAFEDVMEPLDQDGPNNAFVRALLKAAADII
jgi:hypothetical protein